MQLGIELFIDKPIANKGFKRYAALIFEFLTYPEIDMNVIAFHRIIIVPGEGGRNGDGKLLILPSECVAG
jgi:hypothetical protein